MKRIFSFIFALLLVLSIFPVSIPATAEEYVGEDGYVYDHHVAGNGYSGKRYQYFSLYQLHYALDDGEGYIQPFVFTMYNTQTQDPIPAYCIDINVTAKEGINYRRVNLEDSTYGATAAGQLRAIMKNGFYLPSVADESEAANAVRANAKLQELGAVAGVEGLTASEAISATQAAIWQAVHGARLEFLAFICRSPATSAKSMTRFVDICYADHVNGHYEKSNYGQFTEASIAKINPRIKAVYDYLISLEPIPATSRAVGPSSFTYIKDPVIVQNANGNYDITVTTTVDVDLAAGDALTLSAVADSTHYSSTTLHDGEQTVTLTIEDVPADVAAKPVTLNIDGKQTATDYFMFEAEGGRANSQSMIGYDNSQIPVHAHVNAEASRVLNVIKTASGHPLEGIIFDLYAVATLKDYLSGAVKLPAPEDYSTPKHADFIAVTNEKGRATINFTQANMPDSVYLVVERPHPAVQYPIAPFYLVVPSTKEDGTGYEYEISIKPKNQIVGVQIGKDVTELGNDSSNVDAYSSHTWIITTNVPKDISMGKSFVISDTLDNRLDYLGNMKVTIESTDGETVLTELTPETDYTLAVTNVDSLSEGKPSDSFTMTLTRTGMSAIGLLLQGKSFSDYKLRVRYDAQINANADLGVMIPNQATLKYTNSANYAFSVDSDKPVVYTAAGGVNLKKVDENNNEIPLSGATFEVYRTATAEEVGAGGDQITNIAGVIAPVVKVSFFNNSNMEGEKVTSVTTDENGAAAIYGLAHGDYYLLETASPPGYNLPNEAIKLTVNDSSHTEENTIIIENRSGTLLPSTGGIGTTVYTASGIALICMSCLLLYLKLRKNYGSAK